MILGIIGIAIGRMAPIKRKVRQLILLASIVLLILGGIGVLLGLGFVLVICLAGWYEHEPWGEKAMIGWLIIVVCAVYTLYAGLKDLPS